MESIIPIKKEAVEVMCGIAGRLTFLGYETVFEAEADVENNEYDCYALTAKSTGTLIENLDAERDDRCGERFYDFRIELPKKVTLLYMYTEIKEKRLFLEITFDFLDFVNANIKK